MSGQGATPAGWYPDPSDATKQRWWDGSQWTNQQQPAPGYAPPPAPGYGAPGHGQAPAYGQQHGYGYGPGGGEPPKSHLAVAIVAIFFVWPMAIYAIVKSTQVNGLWSSGQFDQARAASAAARRWAWISIILGLVIAVLIVVAAASGTSSSTY